MRIFSYYNNKIYLFDLNLNLKIFINLFFLFNLLNHQYLYPYFNQCYIFIQSFPCRFLLK